MQPKFKIAMAGEELRVTISKKNPPVTMDEFVEVFKNLMTAWGFSEDTVNRYFDCEDIYAEYDETVSELNKIIEQKDSEIERLKGRSFKLCKEGKG